MNLIDWLLTKASEISYRFPEWVIPVLPTEYTYCRNGSGRNTGVAAARRQARKLRNRKQRGQ